MCDPAPHSARSAWAALPDPRVERWRNLIRAAVVDVDPVAIRNVLDEAADAVGIAACVDDVVQRVMAEVFVLSATGAAAAGRPLMATEAVRGWLDRGSAFAAAPRRTPTILLACGPRDVKTVDLESMALLLRHQGWPCRLLGPRVRSAALVVAAQASDTAAVVVSCDLPAGRPQAVAAVEAVRRLGYQVFVSGAVFDAERALGHLPPGYLDSRASMAAARIVAAVSSPDR